jgi:hypothetical protein
MAMPNLAAFANAGYPFTRMADLSETAMVMPNAPGTDDVTNLLTVLGRVASSTGYPATNVTVIFADDVDKHAGDDLFVLGSQTNQPLFSRWQDKLPLFANPGGRLKLTDWLVDHFSPFLTRDLRRTDLPTVADVHLTVRNDDVVLMGFQSPLDGNRSVVALMTGNPERVGDFFEAWFKPSTLKDFQGSVVLLQDKKLTSLDGNQTYHVGHLPFWIWLQWYFSGHPVLMALGLLLICILLALPVRWYLNRRAAARLPRDIVDERCRIRRAPPIAARAAGRYGGQQPDPGSGFRRGALRQRRRPAWQSFLSRFAQEDGRIVDLSQEDRRSTSEGQAYAMFFALVANDPLMFDRALGWTRHNLCGNRPDLNLPAWLWGKSKSGQWGVIDGNSASDADLWMAYALLEGARLWRRAGLARAGLNLLQLIRKNELIDLAGFGQMVLPGRRDSPGPTARCSIRAICRCSCSGGFRGSIRRGRGWCWPSAAAALIRGSAPNGFSPDWIAWNGKAFVVEGEKGAIGSYDAIRTYLWAGMLDPADPLRKDVLAALQGLSGCCARKPAWPKRSTRGLARPAARLLSVSPRVAAVPVGIAPAGSGRCAGQARSRRWAAGLCAAFLLRHGPDPVRAGLVRTSLPIRF